jgi:hypothetical protein
MNHNIRRVTAVLIAALAFAAVPGAGQLHAEGSALDKVKISDAIQSVTISGDLRLRLDERARRGAGTVDRTQNRLRLRVGADIQMPHDVRAVMRLASGTGEQVSENQTYDNLGTEKGIWIDQAYGKWSPKFEETGKAFLQAGKMAMPLWQAYSDDLVYDPDLNPEGFGEGVEYGFKDAGLTLFANGLQMVAKEGGSTSGKSSWLFSQQAGVDKTLPWESRLRVAAAYHAWSDENRVPFTPGVVQDGNARTTTAAGTGILIDRFGVGQLTAELKTKVMSLPLSVQGSFIRNFRADPGRLQAAGACAAGWSCPMARDGYQAGFILGEAKKAGTWEAAYFRKYVESEATVADISDSDFGDGGINIQGHIVWLGYSPYEWLNFRAKAFFTQQIDSNFVSTKVPGSLNGDRKAVNRVQLDAMIKF